MKFALITSIMLPRVRRATAATCGSEHDSEDQRQERRHDEIGNRDSGHGGRHHRIVDPAVLPKSGDGAGQDAQAERGDEGGGPDQDAGPETACDQLGDVEVSDLERRPEIELQDVLQIEEELDGERLDLRRQRTFAIERAARRNPHHEKRQCDDDQQRRQRLQ